MLSGGTDPAEVADETQPEGFVRPAHLRVGANAVTLMTKEGSTMGAARARVGRRLKDIRGAAVKPQSPGASGRDVLAKAAMSWGLSLTCLVCPVGRDSRRRAGG